MPIPATLSELTEYQLNKIKDFINYLEMSRNEFITIANQTSYYENWFDLINESNNLLKQIKDILYFELIDAPWGKAPEGFLD